MKPIALIAAALLAACGKSPAPTAPASPASTPASSATAGLKPPIAPIEFKGLAFGATRRSDFTAAHPLIKCGTRTCFAYEQTAPAGSLTYAGEPARSILIDFIDEVMEGAYITFKPESYATILGALTSKYGSPTNHSTSEYRTQGGLVATQEEATWLFSPAGTIISLARFADSIDHGALSIATAKATETAERAKAAKESKAKKDI